MLRLDSSVRSLKLLLLRRRLNGLMSRSHWSDDELTVVGLVGLLVLLLVVVLLMEGVVVDGQMSSQTW